MAAIAVVAGLGSLVVEGSGAADRLAGEAIAVGRTVGPIGYLFFAILLSCLLVYFPALVAAAGLLYGSATGTLLGLGVAVVASVVQLLIGRRVAPHRLRELLERRFARIERFLRRRGLLAVVVLRLAWGFPQLLNYASGSTTLRVRDMALGTGVGMAPRVYAYAALGGNLGDLGSPAARGAMLLILGFGVLGLLAARWLDRRDAARGLS